MRDEIIVPPENTRVKKFNISNISEYKIDFALTQNELALLDAIREFRDRKRRMP